MLITLIFIGITLFVRSVFDICYSIILYRRNNDLEKSNTQILEISKAMNQMREEYIHIIGQKDKTIEDLTKRVKELGRYAVKANSEDIGSTINEA